MGWFYDSEYEKLIKAFKSKDDLKIEEKNLQNIIIEASKDVATGKKITLALIQNKTISNNSLDDKFVRKILEEGKSFGVLQTLIENDILSDKTAALKSVMMQDEINMKTATLLIEKGAGFDFTIGVEQDKIKERQNPLQIACNEKNTKLAVAIIKSTNFQPEKFKSGKDSALAYIFNLASGSGRSTVMVMLFNRNKDKKFIKPEDYQYVIAGSLKVALNAQDKSELKSFESTLKFLSKTENKYLLEGGKISISDQDLEKLAQLGQADGFQKPVANILKKITEFGIVNPNTKIPVEKSGWILSASKKTLVEVAIKNQDLEMLSHLISHKEFVFPKEAIVEIVNSDIKTFKFVTEKLADNQKLTNELAKEIAKQCIKVNPEEMIPALEANIKEPFLEFSDYKKAIKESIANLSSLDDKAQSKELAKIKFLSNHAPKDRENELISKDEIKKLHELSAKHQEASMILTAGIIDNRFNPGISVETKDGKVPLLQSYINNPKAVEAIIKNDKFDFPSKDTQEQTYNKYITTIVSADKKVFKAAMEAIRTEKKFSESGIIRDIAEKCIKENKKDAMKSLIEGGYLKGSIDFVLDIAIQAKNNSVIEQLAKSEAVREELLSEENIKLCLENRDNKAVAGILSMVSKYEGVKAVLADGLKNKDAKLISQLIKGKRINEKVFDKELTEKVISLYRETGNAELIQLIPEGLINTQDSDGYTLLIAAAEKGEEDIAEILIEKSANLELEAKPLNEKRTSSTALKKAIVKGNEDVALLLMDKDASLNFEINVEENQSYLYFFSEEKTKTLTPFQAANSSGLEGVKKAILQRNSKEKFITFEEYKSVFDNIKDKAIKANGSDRKAELEKMKDLLEYDAALKGSGVLIDKNSLKEIYKLSREGGKENKNIANQILKTAIEKNKTNPGISVDATGGKKSLLQVFIVENNQEMLIAIVNNSHFKLPDPTKNVYKEDIKEIAGATREIFEDVINALEGKVNESFAADLAPLLLEKNKIDQLNYLINKGLLKEDVLKVTEVDLIKLYNEGKIDVLSLALDKGIGDINAMDSKGNTLLHLAAANGHSKLCEKLLSKSEIKTQQANVGGLTPLMMLCMGAANPEARASIANAIIEREGFEIEKEKLGEKGKEACPHVLYSYVAGNGELAQIFLNDERFGAGKDVMTVLLQEAAIAGDVGILKSVIKNNEDLYKEIEKKNSPVFTLLANGKFEELKELIENDKVDLNVVDEKGNTLLFYAALQGKVELVQALLDSKRVDINKETRFKDDKNTETPETTALIHALLRYKNLDPKAKGYEKQRENIFECIKLMAKHEEMDFSKTALKDNAIGKKIYKRGPNILSLACSYKDPRMKELVEIIINAKDKGGKQKVDINDGGFGEKEGEKQVSPIVAAYEVGNNDVFKMLIKESKIDPNARDLKGRPLAYAIYEKGDEDLIQDVANMENFQLNQKDSMGNSIFMHACLNGDKSMAYKILLAKDEGKESLKVDERNKAGQDALMLASIGGHKEVVELLLAKGMEDLFQVNRSDKDGNTALYYAYMSKGKGAYDTFKMLLQSGAEADVKNVDNKTPLMAACIGGNLQIVRELIEKHKLDVNAVDKQGDRPIHYATQNDSNEIFQELVAKGVDVDVNARNKEGVTPLMVAIMNGDLDRVKLLLKQPDIDVNLYDKNGNTAVIYACSMGNKKIAAELLKRPELDLNTRNRDGISGFMVAAISKQVEEKQSERKQGEPKAKDTGVKNSAHAKWEGDRELMNMLIDAGADPDFGKRHASLGSKILKTSLKIGALKFANKIGFSYIAFNPILKKAGDVTIALRAAFEASRDVSESVEESVRKWITKGTKHDVQIDLSNKIMIGMYTIGTMGRMIYGNEFKDQLVAHNVYKNGDKAIYTAADFKPENVSQMTELEQKELHEVLTTRYHRIQQDLDNKIMWPWTRYLLNKLAEEILQVDKMLLSQYKDTGAKGENEREWFKEAFPEFSKAISGKNRDSFIIGMMNAEKSEDGKFKDERFNNFMDTLNLIRDEKIVVAPDVKYNALTFFKRQRELEKEKENPGFFRKIFGFEFMRKFDEKAFEKVTGELSEKATQLDNLKKHVGDLLDRITKEQLKNKDSEKEADQKEQDQSKGIFEIISDKAQQAALTGISTLAKQAGMKEKDAINMFSNAVGKAGGFVAGGAAFVAVDTSTANTMLNAVSTAFSGVAASVAVSYAALPLIVPAAQAIGSVAALGTAIWAAFTGSKYLAGKAQAMLKGEEKPLVEQIKNVAIEVNKEGNAKDIEVGKSRSYVENLKNKSNKEVASHKNAVKDIIENKGGDKTFEQKASERKESQENMVQLK